MKGHQTSQTKLPFLRPTYFSMVSRFIFYYFPSKDLTHSCGRASCALVPRRWLDPNNSISLKELKFYPTFQTTMFLGLLISVKKCVNMYKCQCGYLMRIWCQENTAHGEPLCWQTNSCASSTAGRCKVCMMSIELGVNLIPKNRNVSMLPGDILFIFTF